MDLNILATIKRITWTNMLGSIPHQKFCFYHLPTRGRAGIKLSVTPSMRLYLPRVEARLRGITALWFCRKKGHLHTIPCNEQEWDKELAYNRHFTQYINKTYIIQSTIKVRLRNQNKRRLPQKRQGPRSTPTGLHY